MTKAASRRVGLSVMLLLAAPTWAAPPAVNLQVNLQVELRRVRVGAAAPDDGSFSVDTRSGATTRPGDVTVGTRRRDADETVSVWVSNGGRATLRLARERALPTGEWYWSAAPAGAASAALPQATASAAVPTGGAGFGRTRQWIDASRGLQVQARWPGGNAPVLVDVTAMASGRTTVQTSLSLPANRWVELAHQGDTALQLRVSIP